MKNKLNNKSLILFLFLNVFFGVLIFSHYASADLATQVSNIAKGVVWSPVLIPLGAITALVVLLVGGLSAAIIGVIVSVAAYNNFINEAAIVDAWTIIRDLCNMLFVVILLVIAFATILRQENYSAKKFLPKLLIMAVLINFSRTVFGLIIDFGQVVMLTFVNAWGSAGQFIYITKMMSYFSFTEKASAALKGDEPLNIMSTVAAMLAGIIFMLVSGIVLVVVMGVIVVRMVMLMLYTVLSPLIFMGFAFPPLQKYTGKLWEDFIKNVIIGPVLAFFVWLSLQTIDIGTPTSGAGLTGQAQCFGVSNILCLNNLIPFIVSMGMLVGGLIVAQGMGGMAGNIAGKGLNFAKGAASAVGKAAAYIPAQYAKRAGYGLADKTLGAVKKWGVPVLSNQAMIAQGKLKMQREFEEEKSNRYLKHMDETDWDRIIKNYEGKGKGVVGRGVSFMGRGMESSRQQWMNATRLKKSGDEWGNSMEEKRQNKTLQLIRLYQAAGHSITNSGEDAFRNAELGKEAAEFRNKNAGTIDDQLMATYFFGGQSSLKKFDKQGEA
ncbi:MAG: hypothetical protein PHU73_02235, partial [Patescibacteria group bacterium]|nr:hypothetical protein [Patescibacteria group bacterium]